MGDDYTVRIQIKEPDFYQDTRPSGGRKKIIGSKSYTNVKVNANSVSQAKDAAKVKVKGAPMFKNIKANIPSMGLNVNPRVSVKEVYSKAGKIISKGIKGSPLGLIADIGSRIGMKSNAVKDLISPEPKTYKRGGAVKRFK